MSFSWVIWTIRFYVRDILLIFGLLISIIVDYYNKISKNIFKDELEKSINSLNQKYLLVLVPI